MSKVTSGRGTAVTKWRSGEPLDHRKLNQVVDQVNALVKGARPPQQVFPSPGDIPPVVMQRLQIVSIAGDYLICNPFKGASADTTSQIQVAKPFELRRSVVAWNGLTFTYTDDQNRTAVNASSEEEDQVIVPLYVAGDIILAANNIVGGAGVAMPNGMDLGWIDLNLAARAWAANDS